MRSYISLESLMQTHGGIIQTGPFGSQLHQKDYSDHGVPVIMPKDIVGGRVNESTVARIPEHKADELVRHKVRSGNIIFPRRGEISKCALIREDQAGFICGTGCIKIQLPEEYSPKFLYYYLGLPSVVQWLVNHAIGTTMLNLNSSILGRIGIPDIDLNEQTRISESLSVYDDLITTLSPWLLSRVHLIRSFYNIAQYPCAFAHACSLVARSSSPRRRDH